MATIKTYTGSRRERGSHWHSRQSAYDAGDGRDAALGDGPSDRRAEPVADVEEDDHQARCEEKGAAARAPRRRPNVKAGRSLDKGPKLAMRWLKLRVEHDSRFCVVREEVRQRGHILHLCLYALAAKSAACSVRWAAAPYLDKERAVVL